MSLTTIFADSFLDAIIRVHTMRFEYDLSDTKAKLTGIIDL